MGYIIYPISDWHGPSASPDLGNSRLLLIRNTAERDRTSPVQASLPGYNDDGHYTRAHARCAD